MAMVKVSQVLGSVANILSGAQPLRSTSPDYYEVSSKEDLTSALYFVTYSSHGLLPSFDPPCLISLTWLRICKVPFEIEDSNQPDMSPNGQLPFLMFSNGKVIADEGIKAFAIERCGKHDARSKDIAAATALLRKCIQPALLTSLWLDESDKGAWKMTKKLYSKAHPWPVGEWIVYRRRQQLRQELLPIHITISQIMSEAVDAVRLLSEILANQDYFGGSRPAFVDAIAFGLMAVAIASLPPSNELRSMIETCTNLRSFVSRMRREYCDPSHLNLK